MTTERPLRRVVIKEELVALTGDFMEALVLNQFLYWTSRVRDYDQLLQEEAARTSPANDITLPAPRHGWIYKKAEELSEELMVGRSATTIRRTISHLVEKGWLNERDNPHLAWDRTKQYRVNLATLRHDLAALGYPLDEYKLSTETSEQPTPPRPKNATSNATDDNSNAQELASNLHDGGSEPQHEGAIPENTTEIIREEVESKHKENNSAPAPGGHESDCVYLLQDDTPATNRHSSNTSKEGYSAEFEAFWRAYPKQQNKWHAWRQWQKALKRQRPRRVVAAELIAAAKNYAQSTVIIDQRYVKHPATFLGPDCHYLDYIYTPWPGTGSQNNTPTRLSEQAAAELVETINRAPVETRDRVFMRVRQQLQASGYDVAHGEDGRYVLCWV